MFSNGHGTHCAGTIGSKTYGVAKNVNLVGVKVLNGEGSGEDSEVIAGVNWVVDYVKKNNIQRAVASMSLGGEGDAPGLNGAIAAAIKEGITFAVAAGNDSVVRFRFASLIVLRASFPKVDSARATAST